MDDFDINITIPRGKSNRELVPLGANYEVDTSTSQTNKLVFEIAIQQSNVDSIFVTIKTAQNLILQQQLPAVCTQMGISHWQWDGFNNHGIYDSSLLKQRPISVIFQATKASKQKTINKTIIAKPAKQKWIDVKVDKTKKSIDVSLRLNIKDGGAKGLGKSPHEQLKDNQLYKKLPSGDPKKQQHLRYKSLAALQDLVFIGIKEYWNRNIVTDDGSTYSLNVNSVSTTKDAMSDVAIIYNTNRKWLSSSDIASHKSPLSLLNHFTSQKIVYNTGWIEYNDGWSYEEPIDADREFSEIAAYEIGHEILGTLDNHKYSYHCRGLSTAIAQQQEFANADSPYPLGNEIDVMKYYSSDKLHNPHCHVKASQQDAESLLWLSRIKFST